MSERQLLDPDLDRCSIARTLEVVGERWTMLVLREAFSGVRRFDMMQQRTGAPRQVLTDRLNRLVEEGLLRREPYREPGQRTRHQYRLTRAGMELYPALVALMKWGDKWRQAEAGRPVALRHLDCGAEVHVALRCADGHILDSARDVDPVPLPAIAV
jgi:DNA-binding HxlR family transcriptional regulator